MQAWLKTSTTVLLFIPKNNLMGMYNEWFSKFNYSRETIKSGIEKYADYIHVPQDWLNIIMKSLNKPVLWKYNFLLKWHYILDKKEKTITIPLKLKKKVHGYLYQYWVNSLKIRIKDVQPYLGQVRCIGVDRQPIHQ